MNRKIKLPQVEPFKDCKKCFEKQQWRAVCLYQIMAFMLSTDEQQQFYDDYHYCFECAWFFAETYTSDLELRKLP